MNVNEIIKRVEIVNSMSDYWFVRTDYGKLFDSFYFESYIAIGWDYITIAELKNLDEDGLKNRIAKNEEFDLSTPAGKGNATAIYNKMITFLNLKKDDVIVMPSRNSDRLAFGRIADNLPYTAEVGQFTKRRKVDWFQIKQMEDLNPIFFQVKSNQHTISSIKRFAPYIDRVIGTLFEKDSKTHYVLKIDKEDDISFDELNDLMRNINKLTKIINENFHFNEGDDEFYIKINLQSKGAFELIKSGKSLAVLAFILFCSSCNKLDNQKDRELANLIQVNKEVIKETQSILDSLQVDTNELTKPFINGN